MSPQLEQSPTGQVREYAPLSQLHAFGDVAPRTPDVVADDPHAAQLPVPAFSA